MNQSTEALPPTNKDPLPWIMLTVYPCGYHSGGWLYGLSFNRDLELNQKLIKLLLSVKYFVGKNCMAVFKNTLLQWMIFSWWIHCLCDFTHWLFKCEDSQLLFHHLWLLSVHEHTHTHTYTLSLNWKKHCWACKMRLDPELWNWMQSQWRLLEGSQLAFPGEPLCTKSTFPVEDEHFHELGIGWNRIVNKMETWLLSG